MKKLFFAGALCMMLCVCATGMAGTMFNVCLSKECLTEQEAANQAIQTEPEGFKVTRQSVIPWNDAGERWSVLVELENVSEEAITIDDTWLIACNARKEELVRWSVPAIDGAFWKTNRTVRPGERVVLFAGTDEVIEFKHTAYSKAIFGKGAIEAATFLAGKPAGFYDMSDVIQSADR